MELRSNHWVHRDHHVSLVRHLLVAVLDLRSDPLLERLANHSRTDIDDPLFRRLGEVLIVWEVVGDVWLTADELQDLLDRQALILRHVEVLDCIIEQEPLLLIVQVFEEIDRHVVCMKSQVSF